MGLCTANSPENGTAIMKIPYTKSGSVTFNMIVNTTECSVTVDLATGLIEVGNSIIDIYPNPVGDILNVKGLKSESMVKIYSANGQLMLTKTLRSELEEINVSELPSGMYILKLNTENEIMVKRFIKE